MGLLPIDITHTRATLTPDKPQGGLEVPLCIRSLSLERYNSVGVFELLAPVKTMKVGKQCQGTGNRVRIPFFRLLSGLNLPYTGYGINSYSTETSEWLGLACFGSKSSSRVRSSKVHKSSLKSRTKDDQLNEGACIKPLPCLSDST